MSEYEPNTPQSEEERLAQEKADREEAKLVKEARRQLAAADPAYAAEAERKQIEEEKFRAWAKEHNLPTD